MIRGQKLCKSRRKILSLKTVANPVTTICLGITIQGLTPSARSKSSWKLPRLKDELLILRKNKYSVPFLALTETWLKSVITDA